MAEVSRHEKLAEKALAWLVNQGRPRHKARLGEALGLSLSEVDYCLFRGAHGWLFDSCGRFVQPSTRGRFWLEEKGGEAVPNLLVPFSREPWPCTASRRGVYVGAPGAKVLGALSPGSAELVAELVLLAGGDAAFACRQAETLRRASALVRGMEGPDLGELRDLLAACTNAGVVGAVAPGGCEVGEVVAADEAEVVMVRIAE